MPPKLVDSKTQKRGNTGAAAVKKELDSSVFIRKPTELQPLQEPLPLDARLTGEVANIEVLFPEWTTEGENWQEPVSIDLDGKISYPAFMNPSYFENIRILLGLVEIEPPTPVGSKGKPDVKKAAKKAPPVELPIQDEPLVDEHGRKLPRMYYEPDPNADDAFLSCEIKRAFAKSLSTNERARKRALSSMKAQIDSASTDEERANYQNIYDNFFNETNHITKDPELVEVDSFMCAAFRLVERFAPAVLASPAETAAITTAALPPSAPSAGSRSTTITRPAAVPADTKFQYLWRSIYPQLSNGKPHYNASGKYCVRLFLANKWRKVTVSDNVPVDEDGKTLLASSAEPLELWPTILAKAVYTVFSACGYTDSFNALESDSGGSASIKAASFISNAVFMLTGWQPGTPWNLSETIVYDLPRARSLFQEILFGGAVMIPSEDIPGDIPVIDSDSILANVDDTNGERLLTAKEFRDEYRERLAERARVAEEIASREEKISKICKGIEKAYSETFAFYVNLPDEGLRVYPILGLSFSGEADDIRNMNVLVHWKIGGSQNCIHLNRPAAVKAMTEGLDDPFRACTIVESEWISVRTLMQMDAYCVGLDTQLRLPFVASLGWHWMRPEVTASATHEKVGKAKKDKEAKSAAAASADSLLCGDMGAFPPALISLDTAQFFTSLLDHQSSLDSFLEGGSIDFNDEFSLNNDEASAAVFDQAREIGGDFSPVSSQSRKKFFPKASHLSISLMLHADLPKAQQELLASDSLMGSQVSAPSGVAPSSIEKKVDFENDSTSQVARNLFVDAGLPSDSVLILQELRTDGRDPLVMRIELSQRALVPVTRSTFHIPAERLNPTEKIVFWVRLFTRASVLMSFGCGVPIVSGDAEKMWKELGGHAMVREGESAVTRPHTEQLLFRIPLLLESPQQAPAVKGKDTAKDKHKKKPGKESKRDARDEVDPLPQTPAPDVEQVEDHATIFLYISDREIARTVSMLLYTSSAPQPSMAVSARAPSDEEKETLPSARTQIQPGDVCYTMPRIEGNVVFLSSSLKVVRTLIARCFPPMDGEAVVPSFKWKLLIISKIPIVNKVDLNAKPTEGPVTQRFTGSYFPNNRLLIFRDVLTFDRESLPAALRLSLIPQQAQSAIISDDSTDVDFIESSDPSGIDIAEGVNIIVRLYRKADRKFIREYRARSILQLYHLTLTEFEVEPAKDLPVTDTKTSSTAKGSTKKEEKSKKTHGDTVPPLEVIMECLMDETAMAVPLWWRSRRPFNYDGILLKALMDSAHDAQSSTVSELLSLSPSARQAAANAVHAAVPVVIGGTTAPLVHPQFDWQLDVLAGTITNMAHDTYDLERQLETKNSWEDASAGRAERAEAALRYFMEKKRLSVLENEAPHLDLPEIPTTGAVGANKKGVSSHIMKAPSSPSQQSSPTQSSRSPTTSPEKPSSPHKQRTTESCKSTDAYASSLVTMLATALEIDAKSVERREQLLLSKYLKYEEHIEGYGNAGVPIMIDDAVEAERRRRHDEDTLESKHAPERLIDQINHLNNDLKHYARARVRGISDDAILNAQAFAAPWEARERYRLEVDRLNAELTAELARAEEEANAAAAAAGGKKPPQKKKSAIARNTSSPSGKVPAAKKK